MPFTKNYKTPAELTGVARGAFDAAFERFGVSALLPQRENFTLDYSFQTGAAVLPPAAKFRSFNTESMVNKTSAGSAASGKLPPSSIRLHVDEFQQLQMYGQESAIGDKFEEYATLNAQSIAFRIVLAAAEAIEAGKVTIAERGLALTVDFDRRSDLTATASTPWATVASASPLDDIEALRDAFGKRIGQIRLSRTAMGHLMRNAEIIGIVGGTGSRVSVEDVRSVFRDYGLGEIVVDEDTVPDMSGDEVPVFSADKVILLSAGEIGSTQIGVTAEAFASENGISRDEAAGLFAGAIASDDPTGYDVVVSGILLPVLSAPNSTAVLSI